MDWLYKIVHQLTIITTVCTIKGLNITKLLFKSSPGVHIHSGYTLPARPWGIHTIAMWPWSRSKNRFVYVEVGRDVPEHNRENHVSTEDTFYLYWLTSETKLCGEAVWGGTLQDLDLEIKYFFDNVRINAIF